MTKEKSFFGWTGKPVDVDKLEPMIIPSALYLLSTEGVGGFEEEDILQGITNERDAYAATIEAFQGFIDGHSSKHGIGVRNVIIDFFSEGSGSLAIHDDVYPNVVGSVMDALAKALKEEVEGMSEQLAQADAWAAEQDAEETEA